MNKLNLNEAVFTTKKVRYKGETVRLISLGYDGFWSFLNYEECDIPDSELIIVSLGSILSLDSSLCHVLNKLDLGESAHRESIESDWYIYKTLDN